MKRWRRWASATVIAVLIGAFGAAGAAFAAPAETGKYYVVGEPVNGQQEYLYGIAVATLGDGNRFHEIAALNQGRAEPGGTVFTDGLHLEPGWVLVMPVDAKGTGVKTGRLPSITPSSAPPSTGPATDPPTSRATTPPARVPDNEPPSSSVPSPSSAAPVIGAETTTGPPSTTAREAEKVNRSSAADSAERDHRLTLTPAMRQAGVGLLVLLGVVLLVVVLRRVGFSLRRVDIDDRGPWPPIRHRTLPPDQRDRPLGN